MAQTIPVPEEYKDKLDRYLFLLSRTCANVAFFLMSHKEEPECFNDPLFERLFTEAESAAMDYQKMVTFTKDNLLGKNFYRMVKMGVGHGKRYEDHHSNLIVQ